MRWFVQFQTHLFVVPNLLSSSKHLRVSPCEALDDQLHYLLQCVLYVDVMLGVAVVLLRRLEVLLVRSRFVSPFRKQAQLPLWFCLAGS
jgi:hypothetical protein